MKTWLVIGTALILAGVASVGAYYFQQQRIDSLLSENTELKQRETTPNKDSPTQKDSTSTDPDSSDNSVYTSEKGVKISITEPRANSIVSSPLTISGKVPGSWSFEAQFSVRVVDARGMRLAESPAKLQGDWMTDQLVSFSSTLQFDLPTTKSGTLILLKANPSDLPENTDTLVIPVRFE